MYSFDAKLLLGRLPAVLARGALGMGGLGILFWGPWKGVMEGSPDPGGKTGSWGVVASSPQGTSLPAIWAFGCWPVPPKPVQPRHTRGS